MQFDQDMNCPYCNSWMAYNTNFDCYFCHSCNVSQSFDANITISTWLSFTINKREYSIRINEKDQTTEIHAWDQTGDGFTLGYEVLKFNFVIPNLTPQNVQEKMRTILTFS
jgi:hypothetical protein